MANVSVLTAVYNPNPSFLKESYEALLQQDISWQWVLQVDGEPASISNIPAHVKCDSRVDVRANGERLGVAATRNLGLLACEHEYVQNLDGDDVLQPNALPLLAAAIGQESVGFAFGRTLNRKQDGTLSQWQPAPYDFGLIEPGVIGKRWAETGKHHVTLAATMWRKTLLHAHGGWAAVRGREDLSLLLAVSAHHKAAYVDAVTLHYREHPEQSTKSPFLQGNRSSEHQALCAYRLLAQRQVAGEELTIDDFYYVDEGTGEVVILPPFGEVF